ncbi:MAG: hypothetical protein H0W28_03500 [Pyrinomonadaceae bacterium]|nr:hypothetical protein [Pyrinomonadaceae bacterium]MBA3568401.1 hypothetical protein [Pyrinomonadaceae bacterium]
MLSQDDLSMQALGRHAETNSHGSNTVVLDADVAAVFPDPSSVNEALRKLIQNHRRQTGEEDGRQSSRG